VPTGVGATIVDRLDQAGLLMARLPLVRSRDAGLDAHRVAIAHVAACAEAMDAEETGDPLELESPAVGPYCGCTDCDIREALAVAWPILLADAAVLVGLAGHAVAADLLRAETARVRQLHVLAPDPIQ
jgi:hypothetical protein